MALRKRSLSRTTESREYVAERSSCETATREKEPETERQEGELPRHRAQSADEG